MTPSKRSILIFGPSGKVGHAAALEANKRGANVWLAMRDPNKIIEGLSENVGFSRLQADLLQPESIKNAVKQSGADAAFVYTIWESDDHMRASFDAFKEAGISHIILLSSVSVKGSPRQEENKNNFIAQLHAETEAALEDTGIPYTAIRPAYFSSNIIQFISEIKNGKIEVAFPKARFDFIAEYDIGAVAGALITQEKGQFPREVYLYGPQLLSQQEALEILAREMGREVKITELSEGKWREKMSMLPQPLMDAFVKAGRENTPPMTDYGEQYETEKYNIQKYTGREPTTFHEWVDRQKWAFV
jgi:uncharacterized protein YbjT (DUF2867 family)